MKAYAIIYAVIVLDLKIISKVKEISRGLENLGPLIAV